MTLLPILISEGYRITWGDVIFGTMIAVPITALLVLWAWRS